MIPRLGRTAALRTRARTAGKAGFSQKAPSLGGLENFQGVCDLQRVQRFLTPCWQALA